MNEKINPALQNHIQCVQQQSQPRAMDEIVRRKTVNIMVIIGTLVLLINNLIPSLSSAAAAAAADQFLGHDRGRLLSSLKSDSSREYSEFMKHLVDFKSCIHQCTKKHCATRKTGRLLEQSRTTCFWHCFSFHFP